jgi:hypothetical protein
MTQPYKVIEEIRVKTKEGERTIAAGQIIKLAPSNALRLIEGGKLKPIPEDIPEIPQKQPHTPSPSQPKAEAGGEETAWKNPYPLGSPEGRRESLLKVMEAIYSVRCQGIIEKVLSGQSKVATFQAAVDSWARICAEELKGAVNP